MSALEINKHNLKKDMCSKTLISIGIGVLIGLSPLRNSKLAEVIITITGG